MEHVEPKLDHVLDYTHVVQKMASVDAPIPAVVMDVSLRLGAVLGYLKMAPLLQTRRWTLMLLEIQHTRKRLGRVNREVMQTPLLIRQKRNN